MFWHKLSADLKRIFFIKCFSNQMFFWPKMFYPNIFCDRKTFIVQKVLIDWQNYWDIFNYLGSIVYLSCLSIFVHSRLFRPSLLKEERLRKTRQHSGSKILFSVFVFCRSSSLFPSFSHFFVLFRFSLTDEKGWKTSGLGLN